MDRTERELQQREKFAALSRPRKTVMLVLSVVLATASALVASFVVSGELRWPWALVCGIGVTVALAVKYRDTW